MAERRQASCIVTDHDTVDGVHEALGAGSLHGVEVIAVELSTVLGVSTWLPMIQHDELGSTLTCTGGATPSPDQTDVTRVNLPRGSGAAARGSPATICGFWSARVRPGRFFDKWLAKDGRATWLASG